MSGSGVGAVLVTVLLMLVNCGGRYTEDPSSDSGTAAAQGGTGAATEADECAGAPEAAGAPSGCGGEGGEKPLEAYARLRTACGLSVKVNRRGQPVSIDRQISAKPICYHIK